MRNTIKRVLVVAAATVGVATVGAAVAPEAAQARVGGQVCHMAPFGMPVEVYESGGARYNVNYGQCSPGDVSVIAMRPMPGWNASYTSSNWPFTNRSMSYKPGQWTGILGALIVINGTSLDNDFGGGGSF